MKKEVDLTPIFRQRINKRFYSFDIMAVSYNLDCSILVGYAICDVFEKKVIIQMSDASELSQEKQKELAEKIKEQANLIKTVSFPY